MNSLKKILCVLLVVTMIIPASMFVTNAAAATDIVFSNTSSVSALTNKSDADFTLGSGALRVLAKGSAPTATVNVNGFSGDTNYAVITYKNQTTNSAGTYQAKLTFISGSSVVSEKTVSMTHGYKAYSTVVDVSDVNACDKIKITFFTNSQKGDLIYFYALSFAETLETAKAKGDAAAYNANGETLSRLSEKQLNLTKYSLEEYTIPYWDTDIVYHENVYPLLNSDGSIDDITLMYDVDKIISVRSFGLTTEYKEGVDYEITPAGKLRILTSGSIPCVPYNQHYYSYNASFTYKMIGGGWVRFQEGPAIMNSQLSITYTHKDSWDGFIPPRQGGELDRTNKILENGEQLDIVFFGDSITNGGNSSIIFDVPPYADMWTDMFEKQLKIMYPNATINCINTSVSGGCVSDAEQNVHSAITPYNPDLLVLALGTNDAQFQYSAGSVLSQMNSVINEVKDECPNTEIVLFAPMFSNPECFSKDLFYEYRDGYYNFANNNDVVVADLMAVHDYLLTKKSYTDMSANNLCHLNDFLARAYAQILIDTISPETASDGYKANFQSRLDYITDLSMYNAAAKGLITTKIADAKRAIAAATTAKEVCNIFQDAKDYIVAMPLSVDTLVEEVDFRNLCFDSSTKTLLLSEENNLIPYYHTTENGAALQTSFPSDPHITLKFPTQHVVAADDNQYVILTYKSNAADASAASGGQLFFCAGENYAPAESISKRFAINNDGAWHSVIFDLSEEDWWTGVINQIRFDTFEDTAQGDEFIISSLYLRNTLEEAQKDALYREQILNGTYVGSSSTVIYSTADTLESLGTPAVKVQRGDLDNNNRFNTKDTLRLKKIIGDNYNEPYNELIADVTGDGRINIMDITLLRRIIAGAYDPIPVMIEEPLTNITFNEETSALTVTPKADLFVEFSSEAIDYPIYAAIVYKATEDCANTMDVILSDDRTASPTTINLTCDNDYSCAIIPLPAGYTSNGIFIDTDGLKMEIDSFGIFETLKGADEFTYERLWERKSDKVYNDNIVVNFGEGTYPYIEYFNNTTVKTSASTGTTTFTVTSERIDPYAYVNLESFGIDADEYKYMVYEYKVNEGTSSSSNRGEVFFCSGDVAVPTAHCSILFDLNNSGEYTKQTLDLTDSSFWSGDVYGIRLDYFCNAVAGDSVTVKSVTFCKTESDLQAALDN